MTAVEPQRGDAAAPRAAERTTLAGILETCPYLRSADGPWHGVVPSRSHRCARQVAHDWPTQEHQRAHCLGAGHRTCSLYAAAPLPDEEPRGRFLAPTPVVIEQGSAPLRVPQP